VLPSYSEFVILEIENDVLKFKKYLKNMWIQAHVLYMSAELCYIKHFIFVCTKITKIKTEIEKAKNNFILLPTFVFFVQTIYSKIFRCEFGHTYQTRKCIYIFFAMVTKSVIVNCSDGLSLGINRKLAY
jgi:hypothetical protein